MKKFFLVFLLVFVCFVYDSVIFGDTFYNLYKEYSSEHNYKIISNEDLLKQNKYHYEALSSYVKETDSYTVSNKNELLNMYFTSINNGYENVTFYCDDNYYDCMKDINELDSEQSNFSYINQLVHSFNSYSTIESVYSSNNRVDIKIKRKYTDEEIDKINNEINRIINELGINDYNDIYTKIRLFHDYIANTNKYDKEMAETRNSKYHSDSAIGTLFEGKSICSGYSDTLSIFLDKLGIKNVKVSTEKHVWNAVYIDNNWYHIDLTWDDPVTNDGSDIIMYEYYMLSTDELLNMDDDEHNFDNTIYDFIN